MNRRFFPILLLSSSLSLAAAQEAPQITFTPVPEHTLRADELPYSPQGASAALPSAGTTSESLSSISLPQTPELKKQITLTVPIQGMSLSAALQLIGKTAGLGVLTQNLPNYELRSNLGPMPAGKAIETLLNLYAPGMDAMQTGKLLIVGTPEAVARVRGMTGNAQTIDLVQSGITPEQLSRVESLLTGRVIPYSPGTLIVAGTEQQVQQTKDLLTRLDSTSAVAASAQPKTAAPASVTRTYTVSGDAGQIREAVSSVTGSAVNAIGQQLIVRGSEAQQAQVSELLGNLSKAEAPHLLRRSLESPNVEAEVELLKALFPSVDITPLQSQNLIVVRAGENTQKEILSALEDSRRRTEGLITAYYPTTYSAEQMAQTLRRSQPAARITPVEGRNILMVTGTAAQHDAIQNTIRELQGGAAASSAKPDDMVSRSVKLGYSEAKTLAADLQSLTPSLLALSQSQKEGQSSNLSVQSTEVNTAQMLQVAAAGATGAGQGPQEKNQAPSNLTIRADERTNSLLIIGPRALVEEVVSAVQAIDVPVKSIRVNMRVYQVKANDAQNLGLNWKANISGVSFGQQDGGLSVGYAPSLSPASIEATIRAGINRSRGRTLIDSQFTALSGQETQFNSGGELVFRPSTSSTATNTVQTPAQTYSYGLNITMRPRIAPDGTVVMALDTTLGNTPTRGILDSIQQSRQSLKTAVQIRPGETIVLGGIVTNSVSDSSSGIPGLRDIPVIGGLFGSQSKDANDEALVFVLNAEEVKAEVAPARQQVTAEPAPKPLPVTQAGEPNLPPSPPQEPTYGPAVSSTGVERVEILPNGGTQ